MDRRTEEGWGEMDFGSFDGFWRRLAQERLHAESETPVEAILDRLLASCRSCVVCHLLRDRAFDLAAQWQYALAQDPHAQAEFIEAQTWCNRHGWFFQEIAAPQTLGRLHRELCGRVQAWISRLLHGDLPPVAGGGGSPILGGVFGERRCPLCEDEAAFHQVLLGELGRGLASGPLRPAFAASAGVCLPHLAALLDTVADEGTTRFLLESTADHLRRMMQELETFEAETASRRRRYGSAGDAPLRAMARWVGFRGMAGGADSGEGPSSARTGMDSHGIPQGEQGGWLESGPAPPMHASG